MVQLSSPSVIPCRNLARVSKFAINSIHRGVNVGVLKLEETKEVLSLLAQVKTGEVSDPALSRFDIVRVVGAFRSWRENLSTVGHCIPSNTPYTGNLAELDEMQTALKLLGFPGLAEVRAFANKAFYYARLSVSAVQLGSHSLADARTALVVKKAIDTVVDGLEHNSEAERGLIITEGRVAASKVVELYQRPWWGN